MHVVSFYLLSSFLFLAYSRRPQIGCYTYTHISAYLECMSETCCTRLAKMQDAKKSPKIRHLGTIVQLCRAISSQLRHISTSGKKVVKQQYPPTCRYNMVNFGPLAAKIFSLVWGTPANFNGFCVLAALLHCTLVVGVSQTLRH